MADNDVGFMQALTGSAYDEEEAVMNQPISDDEIFKQSYGLTSRGGARLGAGVGGLIAGIKKPEGSSLGYWERAGNASQRLMDGYTASQLGITVNDLNARRAIRSEMLKNEYQDDGTPSARLKIALRAVEIAKAQESPEQLASALAMVDQLKKEQGEWDKLQAEIVSKDASTMSTLTKTARDASGKRYTGLLQLGPNGEPGLLTTQNGELIHKPFTSDFNLWDPEKHAGRAARDMSLAMRDVITPTDRRKLHEMAAGANAALGRTDRIISSLWDAHKNGIGADALIGPAGELAAGVDNFLRATNAVVREFAPSGWARDQKNFKEWKEKAEKGGILSWLADDGTTVKADVTDLIPLPANISAASAMAQQYRANIMEMAYMAARLAEPSNRGLSDKDIEAAITRITAGTSNPQVMVRRFLEMQLDASNELDFQLSLYHGSLGNQYDDENMTTNEKITLNLVGEGYAEYNAKKKELFQKYGVIGTEDNRVILGDPRMGTDINPGGGIYNPGGAPRSAVNPQFTDEERLDMLLGKRSEAQILRDRGQQ